MDGQRDWRALSSQLLAELVFEWLQAMRDVIADAGHDLSAAGPDRPEQELGERIIDKPGYRSLPSYPYRY